MNSFDVSVNCIIKKVIISYAPMPPIVICLHKCLCCFLLLLKAYAVQMLLIAKWLFFCSQLNENYTHVHIFVPISLFTAR